VLAAGLALAASVSWGVADYLGGIKSRRIALLAVLAIAQPVGLAAIAIVVAARGEGPPGTTVLWAVPAALVGTVGITALYRGLATGTVSVVAPVAATGAVIPVVIGIATGDRPSAVQIVGFPLAIGGVVLASRERGDGAGRARIAAGVPWGILAALGFGGYFVPMHAAAEADFLWATLLFRVTAAVLVLAAVVAVRPSLRVGRADLVGIAAIGILDSTGNLFFAASSSVGLVSVVSVLASLYPAVTVALAWLHLRERIGGAQAVGVAAALGGVVLIAAG
jgi:drug/metabolite transporter (DMT)-like permease